MSQAYRNKAICSAMLAPICDPRSEPGLDMLAESHSYIRPPGSRANRFALTSVGFCQLGLNPI
jgi:hypothetical protein